MSQQNLATSDYKLKGFYLLAIITGLVFLAYRVALIFYVQPDIGGVEVNVIYFVQQLLDGKPVYQDPEQVPYSIAQYSPAYYYLVAGVARLSGTGPDDILDLFTISRIISLVFNILFSGTAGMLGRKIFGSSRQISILIAVLSFIFLQITSFSRPDSMGHLFFMLSLNVFMQAIKKEENTGKPDRKLIIFSALIAVAALFSKQNAFLIPVIVGCWLLWRKKILPAALFGIVYVAATGFCLLLLSFAGELSFFTKNVIQGVNNGISMAWLDNVLLRDFYHGFGLLFVLLFIVLIFLLKTEKRLLLRFSLFALVALFILQNILALKNGSNPGYFTEWWTLVIVLAGHYLPSFTGRLSTVHKAFAPVLISVVLVMKLSLLAQPLYRMLVERPFHKAYTEYYTERAIADTLLQQAGSSAGFKVFPNYYTAGSYMSLLLFRHVVMPQMDIVILASYPYKSYDYTNFVQGLQQGRFPWMIMFKTGPQKQFFETRLDAFMLKDTLSGYNIYYYNP